jgi:hypothetical protein
MKFSLEFEVYTPCMKCLWNPLHGLGAEIFGQTYAMYMVDFVQIFTFLIMFYIINC